MELCLGTVQFGMDYGVASKGRPSEKECIKILEYAYENGIKTFDTAIAYGTSQRIIAQANMPRQDICIITKISPNNEEEYFPYLKNQLEKCLEQLKTSYVDCCLFHNATYINDDEAMYALHKLKEAGLTNKTGISVYAPLEFSAAQKNKYAQIIQIPYNILDRRLDNLFEDTKEIHSRSAFLQGLLLSVKAPAKLHNAQIYIDKINEICNKNGISRTAYLLNFIKTQKKIKKIVFGVDNLAQLKEIIKDFNTSVDKSLFVDFFNVEEELINPVLWSKNV